VLEAPGGGVLNLRRGERLAVRLHARTAGLVRVSVLTPRGEPVREFVRDARPDETLSLEWDGRNAGGEPVASGTYAIRVDGGGVRAILRVVVIRK
jgi:hypothetical protein